MFVRAAWDVEDTNEHYFRWFHDANLKQIRMDGPLEVEVEKEFFGKL